MSAVPIRDVVWACDCAIGGGDRHALVHHQGCASQAHASALPLALVVTDSADERATVRCSPQPLPVVSWHAPPPPPPSDDVATVRPSAREASR